MAIVSLGAGCAREGSPGGAADDLTKALEIHHAAVWPTARMATLGFRLRSAAGDTLRAVLVAGATDVSLHLSGPGGRGMVPVVEVPVTPGQELVFNEGGPHVMIMGLARPLRAGDSIQVIFRFSQAGEIRLVVPVLRYTEAVRLIGK